jgi:hypothetical protein
LLQLESKEIPTKLKQMLRTHAPSPCTCCTTTIELEVNLTDTRQHMFGAAISLRVVPLKSTCIHVQSTATGRPRDLSSRVVSAFRFGRLSSCGAAGRAKSSGRAQCSDSSLRNRAWRRPHADLHSYAACTASSDWIASTGGVLAVHNFPSLACAVTYL